jgi:fructokinase
VIVTFGECLVDLFAHPRGASIADASHFVPCFGGAPANVAVVAARLGARARFVGAVGRDAHGDRLVRELAGAGVDVRSVVRVPERTGITFVRVADDGQRSFLFYRNGGADYALSRAHLDALAEHPLEGASWLVLGSSALVSEPVASAARVCVEEARRRGVRVLLDLNVRAHLWGDRAKMMGAVRWLIEQAAVVKASEDDLRALGVEGTLDALRALVGEASAVLTLAERGAVAWVRGAVVEAAAPSLAPAQVVDTTGAGDAFVGAMLAVLSRAGEDETLWREALGVGCAVGTRAVTAMGAVEAVRAPWPEAVTRALAKDPIGA